MLLGLGVSLHAQITIAIHDSSLQRSHHGIPLYGSVQLHQGDSLDILIAVDPRMVDLDSVVSAQSAIPSVQGSLRIVRQDSAVLQIRLWSNSLTISQAPLAMLYLNLLAGPDTLTTLRPILVLLNSVPVDSTTLSAGLLHYLNADPVNSKDGEYIGVIYPNPGVAPAIRYRLLNACAPHFSLFDTAGRLILDEVVTSQNSGSAVFQFSGANYATLCDGMYFVRLITPVGVYVSVLEVLQ